MSSAVLSMPAQASATAVKSPRFALVGLGTVAAAVGANTLVYVIGGAFVAYNAAFLPLANVSGEIVMTVFPAIVAVLLYAALRRFTRHPARIFTIVAAVTFLVTLVPVFTYIQTVPGVTDAQTALLVLMHIVAAGVIVRMLTATQTTVRP